jgi:Ca2+-binding RTX toxin-like protein
MITRLARLSWKPSLAVAIALTAVTAMTGVAIAGYAYTVVFGTPGNDVINEAGKPGNYHIYAFQGSDAITAGNGNITRDSHGNPQVNGYDLLYGDGKCAYTPQNDDSYCDHPEPWQPQDWTDSPSSTDTITGGVGPDWIVGGGGDNVLKGSQTYDVITGGPHVNTITGGKLGSAIIANHAGAKSTITLPATNGVKGYDGLTGVPNAVDVYNGTAGDVVKCSGPSNRDIVYADRGDVVTNCYKVYYSAPRFPGQATPQTSATSAMSAMTFPPGMGSGAGARDRAAQRQAKTHKKASKPRSKKHSATTKKHAAASRH